MWADWSFEDPENNLSGSLGKGWVPVKPLEMRVFEPRVLGADCVGHKQLKIASDVVNGLRYWRMIPHNEVLTTSTESYCLAELGEQYLVYAPEGGKVELDLARYKGEFDANWLDPRNGSWTPLDPVQGGSW